MEAGVARRVSKNTAHHHSDTQRPTAAMSDKVDGFVTHVVMNRIDDKKAIDIERLINIKNQLHAVIEANEDREEFRVREEMSARKRELDQLIETADEDYAARKREYDIQATLIENQLLENHRHVLEVQQQSMIKELKNMNEYLFYNSKITQQIADIDASLDSVSCFTSCCGLFPPKEILQKKQQLKLLRAEQDAFASEDHTVVSRILMQKMHENRELLLKQQAELVKNQPKETTQLLLDERARLQANIDAERQAYYYTISPAVMLNLVRLQSFLKRTQISLREAKSAAQSGRSAIKISLIETVLGIVNTFLKKFNEMCGDFVCRPPANEENKISYAQYCDRFHRLEEKHKRLLIKGLPKKDDVKYEATKQEIQQLNETIFREHVEEAPVATLAASGASLTR